MPNRPLRRREKSITEREMLDKVISDAQICHLACCLEDIPYVIPISFGYDGKTVYFHTAPTGKKNDIFLQNPTVCLAFETDLQLITDQKRACDWTFDFKSIIATGTIKEIKAADLKEVGLNQIMHHYSGKDWMMPADEISKTKIWAVELDHISGKQSPPGKKG
jgi:nitroimidazol reductase NimA-like FMN-containing flavoprotein (pyridoxamine 5'-phosphate oxidase superfamily)